MPFFPDAPCPGLSHHEVDWLVGDTVFKAGCGLGKTPLPGLAAEMAYKLQG